VETADVRDCHFDGNEALSANGGAITVIDSSGVILSHLFAEANTAHTAGGALFVTYSSDISLVNSHFEDNTAVTNHGSAVFVSATSIDISGNTFQANNAQSGGGTVFWEVSSGMYEPSGLSGGGDSALNEFINNSALYGNDYATDLARLVYLPPPQEDLEQEGLKDEEEETGSARWLQTSATSSGLGLWWVLLDDFDEEVLHRVRLHDAYGNVVLQRDVFVAASINVLDSFSCGGEQPYISGMTLVQSTGGQADLFFATHCFPSGAVNVSITVSGEATVQSVTVEMRFRDCNRGEFYSAGSCHECAAGSYTLTALTDLSSDACLPCPPHSSCHGDVISVNPGYWRLSDNSSFVLECPVAKGCAGKLVI
jgi:hypothetical protein